MVPRAHARPFTATVPKKSRAPPSSQGEGLQVSAEGTTAPPQETVTAPRSVPGRLGGPHGFLRNRRWKPLPQEPRPPSQTSSTALSRGGGPGRLALASSGGTPLLGKVEAYPPHPCHTEPTVPAARQS